MTTKCPICDNEVCEELIIDLALCSSCNHIFKLVPFKHEKQLFSQLHFYDEPIKQISNEINNLPSGKELFFCFPSMMFYDLELYPSKFYKKEYNHYFNQMSLMVLLKHCGLKIIEQKNAWCGDICETHVKCIKE